MCVIVVEGGNMFDSFDCFPGWREERFSVLLYA